MRRGFLSAVVAAAAFTVLGGGLASAAPPQAPDGFTYEPAKEHVFLGIRCPGTGTCTATYFLGLQPGTESVGNLGTASPAGWLLAAIEGDTAFGTYTADESLQPTYVLRTNEAITGQVKITGWAGPQVVAADSTVRVVLSATKAADGSPVQLGSATVNKLLVTPNAAGQTYQFSIQPAAELDGVKIENLQAELYAKSINVLQNGFIDGEGGSWFDLPHYALVPA